MGGPTPRLPPTGAATAATAQPETTEAAISDSEEEKEEDDASFFDAAGNVASPRAYAAQARLARRHVPKLRLSELQKAREAASKDSVAGLVAPGAAPLEARQRHDDALRGRPTLSPRDRPGVLLQQAAGQLVVVTRLTRCMVVLLCRQQA